MTQEDSVKLNRIFGILAKCSRGKEYKKTPTELNRALKMCNKCVGKMEWVRKKINQKMFYILQEFCEE